MAKFRGIGIMLSVGRWGGVYYVNGWSKRLCLGWLALTFFPTDGDDIIYWASKADIDRMARPGVERMSDES